MGAKRPKAPRPAVVIEHRPAGEARPALEIRSSTRRKKTATAWWQGQTLIVAVPAHVRGSEREEIIEWLIQRSHRRRPTMAASDPELLERARILVKTYDLRVEPASVRFVSTQNRRWGSCTPETGAIRLSDRLAPVPGWVLDAVLVHELAHLAHADHGEDFRRLADRFPRQKEASIFLDGFHLGSEIVGSRDHVASEGEIASPLEAPVTPDPPSSGGDQGPTTLF